MIFQLILEGKGGTLVYIEVDLRMLFWKTGAGSRKEGDTVEGVIPMCRVAAWLDFTTSRFVRSASIRSVPACSYSVFPASVSVIFFCTAHEKRHLKLFLEHFKLIA